MDTRKNKMNLATKTWGTTSIKVSESVSTAYGLDVLGITELNPLMGFVISKMGLYPSIALSVAVYHIVIIILLINYEKKLSRYLFWILFYFTVLVAFINLTIIIGWR